MERLFEQLETLGYLSLEAKEGLASIVQRRLLPKGHLLHRAGTVCSHLWFIEKGLTRQFYYKDGKDVTDWLCLENTFTTSVLSLFTGMPDRHSIELLEDSIIIDLPYPRLETLFSKHHDLNFLARLWGNHGIVQLQQRLDDLHFSTAFERYAKLIETSPTIIQRVPLGIIASFLGVTQETLSRIRAQLSTIDQCY
jgi:CRP-like cAMP-binding protein